MTMNFDARIFTWLVLTEASAISAALVLPYAAALHESGVRWRALIKTFVASQVLFAPTVAAGLWLGNGLGLGAPFLDYLVSDGPARPSWVALIASCSAGAALAMILWYLDANVFENARRPLAAAASVRPPPLLRCGAVLYGAIAEEVIARLGVLTVAAVGLERLVNTKGQLAGAVVLGAAVVLSAVVFALGHLPSTSRIAPLTRGLVLRCLILNGLAGLLFGTLYCAFGLEAGMLAHGSADLMIQFALPRVRRRTRPN